MVKDAILSPASTSPGSSDSPILHNKKDAEPYWPMIGTKDNIPGWLQDNDFIISGHPMPTHSYKRSFRLWRCLHMETMNIWTHLLGSAAFVGAGITLHRSAISSRLNLTTGDKFAFGISLSAAALCFGLSTTFHTTESFLQHSPSLGPFRHLRHMSPRSGWGVIGHLLCCSL